MFSLQCNRSSNACIAESWKLETGGMWGLEHEFDITELSRGRSSQGSSVSWLGNGMHFLLNAASHLMHMHPNFESRCLCREHRSTSQSGNLDTGNNRIATISTRGIRGNEKEHVGDTATTAQPNNQSEASNKTHNLSKRTAGNTHKIQNLDTNALPIENATRKRPASSMYSKTRPEASFNSVGSVEDLSESTRPASIAEEVYTVHSRWFDQHDCTCFEVP
jgi:hypothetical protein